MKETIRKIAEQTPLTKKMNVFDVVKEGKDSYAVYIESLDGITIDDCSTVSKYIRDHLPENTQIGLTVSSVGLDKPLRSPIQFQQNIGQTVEVETSEHKKVTGTLISYTPEFIILSVKGKKKETKEYQFNFNEIKKVRIKLF